MTQPPTMSKNMQGVRICHSTNQKGTTFHSRGSLLEWSLSPSESKWWYAPDANQWQVLSM